jgi:hypothetical protein
MATHRRTPLPGLLAFKVLCSCFLLTLARLATQDARLELVSRCTHRWLCSCSQHQTRPAGTSLTSLQIMTSKASISIFKKSSMWLGSRIAPEPCSWVLLSLA